MSAKAATLVLLLSAVALAWSITAKADEASWLIMLLGSFVSGLLYAYAWGWKGVGMSFIIAFTYSVAGFLAVLQLPASGDLLAGLAFVGVVFLAIISFIVALIGGVIGALLHRRRY